MASLEKIKSRLFGGIELTWPKLIISAIVLGLLTGIIAMIPALHYTSFNAITVTFEVWILIGIIIITNSKSNLDSALKCFVFFLISQPLVYLIQVPFNELGFGLFGYYKYWFIWTILCLPMGYIGYYMKENKWWGYLILLPMILITASSFKTYLSDFQFSSPRYILITLFCALMMILYPFFIFEDKKISLVGAIIGICLIIACSVINVMNPPIYPIEYSDDSKELDETYSVYLEDDKYGEASIKYIESIEEYMIHLDLKHRGDTTFVLVSPDGEKEEYSIHIERDTYEINKK